MTLSAWVRYESFDQNWSRIFDFGNGQADNNIILGHKQNTSTLAFHIYDGVGSPGDAELEVENFFVLDEWVHVTATVDTDGTLSIYKNGDLAAQGPGVVPQEMVRSGNYIGKSHWSGDGYLEGSIDDVVLINGALAADEVQALFQANTVESLLSDSFHVIENSAQGTVVGTASATDADNPSLTYTLTNDAGGRFTIHSSTGEITVTDSADLNHEDTDSYSITVVVSDGELTDSKTYTVHVTNTPEAPVIDNPVTATGTDDSGLMNLNLLNHATAVVDGETLSVNSLTLVEGDDSGVTFSGNTMTIDASAYAYLPEGVSETIGYSYNVVGSAGESSLQTVTITLTGNNESAVITGIDNGSLAEDTGSTLSASGTLNISDEDSDEDFFTVATHNGSHGSLTIDTSGNWSYIADNNQAAIQQLGEGDSLTDTITVSAVDGTTHDITLTITGTNDAAIITGSNSATATEDSAGGDNNLVVSGALAISDTDLGEEFFIETNLTGSYGTLSLNEDGQWTYVASNTQTSIQQLATGDSIQDGFDITSADGTLHQIIVTINGTNDGANIIGDSAGLLLEDQSILLTSSGSLSVTDMDIGEASFIAETIPGTYGSLTINTQGDWNYSANSSQAVIQMLGDGDSLTDTITIQSFDGTSHNVVVTINGTNDIAVINGVDAAVITEDTAATLTTSGTLTVSDTDSGEDSFSAETVSGTYGSLTIDTSGNWNYSADNSQNAIQLLSDGDSLTDTIQVQSIDGTTHDVAITINGTNDVAVIAGVDAAVVIEDAAATLTTSGTLTVSDTDSGEGSFSAKTVSGTYGSLTIDASGNWNYSADNSQNAIQSLADGDSLTDTIQIQSVDGTSHDVVITINGTNDVAVIAGVDAAVVIEDAAATLTTSGTLTVSDTDSGEGSFSAKTVSGTYGSLTIDASGNWNYSADNSQNAIQSLADGDSLTDTIQIQSVDGTSHDVVITINGTNDVAIIAGADAAVIIEDAAATLTTSGTLTVSDTDSGEGSFSAKTVSGTYGSLTIDASGNWNYSANNSQASIQALADGDSLTDTLQIQSIDGMTHDVVITINGTNDDAIIAGVDAAVITEDASATLTTSGTLTVSDTDTGKDNFIAEIVSGTYGSLTIDANGNWNYSADNSQNAIQSLADGDSLTETIQIQSFDGTSHDVVITINGTNDVAVIAGVDAAVIIEDAAATLTTSGTLTVSDTDSGEGSFSAKTVSGTYGSLTIDASGNWNYSADNSQNAIQSLADGDSLTDTIQIQSVDGTSHDVVITINGTNDVAIIAGADAAVIIEDAAATLTTSGTLTVSDTDSGEGSFSAKTVSGTYGSLTIDASGNWNYSANNSQASIQALADGDSLTDTLQIQSIDGMTHDVVITINGTNDDAIIAGVDAAVITEDAAATLTTSGTLTVSDADSGEDSFSAETVSGTYGSLTIDANGNWNYSADNSQNAIQSLADGDSLTDTIQIQSVDGTSHDVVITINGTNDVAIIAGVDAAVIIEDAAATLTTSGTLTVSDTDSGEDSFTSETVSGTYGSFTIDASGNWNYSADSSHNVIQSLADGDNLTETIQIQSVDGTSHDVVITINGTNDVAVIAGVDAAVITEDAAATLTTSGTLTVSDTDSDSGEDNFITETVSGTYGSLTIDANGNWNYSADNSQNAIQSLADGDSLTETIQIQSVDGTSHDVVITINGTNDVAVIAGVDAAVITEDAAATLTTSGTLTVSDTDSGEDSFTAETVSGTYGSLTIDASGNWNYSADNSQNAIQLLSDGDSLTDTIQIQSIDGTTHDVVITINGTNDVAVIGGVDAAVITEDVAATLTTSGTLTVSDADSGEDSFSAETVSGTYGSLTIDANGNWNYSADNSQNAIQLLSDGDSLTDTIQIQSIDGTTHDVVITINGTNDVAVIGGVDAAVITEDVAATLTTSGTLTVSDADSGEDSFSAETVSGTYGSLTIDANGNWNYSADNSQNAIQLLSDGDSLTDTIQIQSIDGTTHDVVITINGTNDVAVIGGVDAAVITEDVAATLTTSGTLTVSDADSGEDSFSAETVSGTYGSFTIDASGNWNYSADSSHNVIQSLAYGDNLTETIQIQSVDGTSHDVVITINGTNDVAVIAGVDAAVITEDAAATLTTSGTLTVSDTDSGEDNFIAETVSGTYGSLTIDANGNWNYSADNSQNAIQSLADGDSLTETIQIQSVDGTSHDVVITINGTNDVAVIAGVDATVIIEDAAATLTTSGTLTVSDTDSGEGSFSAETVSGTYGSLTIDASGNWNYSANNSQASIQALADGDSLTDTLQIQSIDGMTHDVVITINGTNDDAIIAGVDAAVITEDASATLTTSGTLTVSDADSGEDSFSAETVSGTYGSLTIDANGNWNYSADNSQNAIQSLADGDSLTDTIQIQSVDGTSHDVVITINGTNDSPVATADTATDTGSIPTLSSNNDQGIILTASSSLGYGGYEPYRAFDGVEANASNNQNSWAISGNSGWLQAELPSAQRIAQYSIKAISFSSRQPQDWEILASNDGVNFTVIDSRTGVNNWSPRETKEFMIDDSGSYSHFRINITDNNGNGYTGFDSFQLFEWSDTTAQTSEHETLSFDVLTNDHDVDSSDRLTLDSVEVIDGDGNPISNKGLASVVDGKLLFNPNGDFAGLKAGDSETVTVRYTISDSHGTQSASTAEVTVFGTNFAPKTSNIDLGSTNEDSAITITEAMLLANASDADGDTLNISSLSLDSNAQGSLVDNGDSTWTFTPDSNFNGHDISFSFTVSDGTPGSQASAHATLDVLAVNDDAAAGAALNRTTTEDTSFTVTEAELLANASDIDGDALSVTDVSVVGGSASVADNNDGTWTVTPDADWSGSSQLSFDIFDGTSIVTGQVNVTVTAMADSPSITIETHGRVINSQDFESPIISSEWQAVSGAPDGWTSATGIYELQKSGFDDITAYEGNQWLELDNSSSHDSLSYQLDTSNGQPHVLEMAVRQKSSEASDDIEIYWGDDLIATITPTTSWETQRIELPTFDGSTKQLKLQEASSQNNGVGALIDSLKLIEVGITHSSDPAHDFEVSSLEDTAIPLNIGTALGDSDGSETLSVTLAGIPAGSILTDGSNSVSSDGSDTDISGWSLSNLSLTPPANSNDDFTLTVTATGTESSNNDFVDTRSTIRVNLLAANDAPTLDNSGIDQTVAEETAYSYTLPDGTFSNLDGDTITTTATLADGNPLPAWLSFDADTNTFSGIPDDADVGTLSVKVTFSDGTENTDIFVGLDIIGNNSTPGQVFHQLLDEVAVAYSFNDTSDATDNGHILTMSGSATLGTGYGGTGTAFEMNGTTGHGEIDGLETGGAMSVSTWVKFDSFDQNWSRIFDFGNASASDNILLGHMGTSNDLAFHVYDGAGGPAEASLDISDFFTVGEWVHVTATIAGDGTMSIYKNGVLAGQTAGFVPTEMVRTNNYIGKSNWSANGHLDGAIDEFAVYNKALTADEVKAVFEISSLEDQLNSTFYVSENSDNSSVVGTISATDVDADNLTYSLTDDAGGRFSINSSTGEVTVVNSSLLDYESNSSHQISVQVSDGVLTDTQNYTIFVTDENDAPIAANNTLTATEDSSLTLATSDFSFSDADAGNTLHQIQITALPANGTLLLNSVPVTVDQVISKADIDAGLLTFTSSEHESGDNYASFDFKVHDGTTYSDNAYSLTLDVEGIVDGLTLSSSLAPVDQQVFSSFAISGWSAAGHHFSSSSGEVMNVGSSASRMIDTSADNVSYTFSIEVYGTFRIEWNGQVIGTASVPDYSPQIRTFTLPDTEQMSTELKIVTINRQGSLVNTSLHMTSTPIEIDEDTSQAIDISLALVDTDGSETLTVELAAVPPGATISDGVNSHVSTGASVDISGWDYANLSFTPPPNEFGTYNLQVTATSSENGQQVSESLTLEINVLSVDDAPVSADNALLLRQGDDYNFKPDDFSFSDVDAGDSLQSITITSLPAEGILNLNGVAVTADQVITAADISGLSYTAPATDPDVSSSFGFTVSDGSLSSNQQTFDLNVRGTYSNNLLTNAGANNGTTGWSIIENSGSGWGIEGTSHDGDGKSWGTSWLWNKKSQTVDLVAAGFTKSYLDSVPDISVSDWYKNKHNDDNYYLKVELRGASNEVITSFDTGTLTATDDWKEAASTFSDYGSGVRYVYFEHGGRGHEIWDGQFGAQIDDSEVVLKVGDEELVELIGSDDAEVIDGSEIADTIKGEGGADTLLGEAGADIIFGGSGNDTIIGGEGNDILTGGDDSDTFIWHAEDAGSAETPAEDIITDFHIGQGGDVLDLSDVLADEENHQLDEYLHFNFSEGDTTLEIKPQAGGSTTQKVTLQGVDLSSLGNSDSEIINNLLNDGNLQVD